jgi:hypothetical protein
MNNYDLTPEKFNELVRLENKKKNRTEKLNDDADIITEKLAELGYYIINFNNSNRIVKITDNIVEEVTIKHINKIVRLNKDNWSLKTFTSKEPFITEKNDEIIIKFKEIEFMRDTKNEIYFYFKEFFIKVTKDKITKCRYDSDANNKYILKSRIKDNQLELDFELMKKELNDNSEANEIIINDNFIEFASNKSMFAQFVRKTCTNPDNEVFDKKRFLLLITAIGYLISQYKALNYAKAIFLTELNYQSNAAGRTGKGLIMQAIGKVRNVKELEVNDNNNFKFQEYDFNDDIIFINEVNNNFDIKKYYKPIADTFQVRKKFREPLIVNYLNSPKLAFASNFLPLNFDDSTTDRIIIVELYRYFNKNRKPEDVFGKMFFDETDIEEWNYFYLFMMLCSAGYLRNNNKVYEYEPETVRERALNINFDEELIEVFEKLPTDELITNKKFISKFENTKYSTKTINYLKKQLAEFCKIKKYQFINKHSGTSEGRGFEICTKK